jgi:hypothetical protein
MSRGRNSQRRQSGRQQGAVLRAASAAGGRVVPTIEEEAPDFDEVPEEILAQMPDELLSDPRENKLATKRGVFAEPGEDEGEDSETEELTFEVQNTQSFAPSSGLFEEGFVEDEEPSLHEGLAESISAVERVYQDMDLRARSVSVQPAVEEMVVISNAIEPPITEELDEEGRDDQEEDLVSYASSSPFETELDPVTGIYRLKVKPQTEEGSPQADLIQGEPVEDRVDNVAADLFTSSEVTAQGHEVHQNTQAHEHPPVSEHAHDTQWNFQQSQPQSEENAETLADEFEQQANNGQAGEKESDDTENHESSDTTEHQETHPHRPQEV